MKRLFGILSVLVCATTMIYAQASGIATLQSSDVVIPLNGAAAKGKVIDFGYCGENVEYELYDDYTLRIYGNGMMDDYRAYLSTDKEVPWGIELQKKIKEVVIENGVTHIGGYSFKECASLTKVTIPNSVKSIGYSAFYRCTALANITISNSLTNIGPWAFADCPGLTSFNIPNSVTNIGESAFSGCSGLTSINIPNSVTSIGESAFDGCAKLKHVKIPKNVTEIGYGAFPQTGDENLVIEFTSGTPANLLNADALGFLCTIYVPESALETYRNAKYWKDHADQILPKEQTTGINLIGYKQSEKKSAIYDLQGNKVTEMQSKGIYIVNGKKVMK